MDLNHRPLPYQFKDSPSSEAATLPWSVVMVRPMGWVCGPVAVTSAVSDRLARALTAARRARWSGHDACYFS
jgi:hypothetical protein